MIDGLPFKPDSFSKRNSSISPFAGAQPPVVPSSRNLDLPASGRNDPPWPCIPATEPHASASTAPEAAAEPPSRPATPTASILNREGMDHSSVVGQPAPIRPGPLARHGVHVARGGTAGLEPSRRSTPGPPTHPRRSIVRRHIAHLLSRSVNKTALPFSISKAPPMPPSSPRGRQRTSQQEARFVQASAEKGLQDIIHGTGDERDHGDSGLRERPGQRARDRPTDKDLHAHVPQLPGSLQRCLIGKRDVPPGELSRPFHVRNQDGSGEIGRRGDPALPYRNRHSHHATSLCNQHATREPTSPNVLKSPLRRGGGAVFPRGSRAKG